jgi:hypothetical protein
MAKSEPAQVRAPAANAFNKLQSAEAVKAANASMVAEAASIQATPAPEVVMQPV